MGVSSTLMEVSQYSCFIYGPCADYTVVNPNGSRVIGRINTAPLSKTQYLHFRLHTNYFLLPWKIPEETIAVDQFMLQYLKTVSTRRVGRCKILRRPEQQIFTKRLVDPRWKVTSKKNTNNKNGLTINNQKYERTQLKWGGQINKYFAKRFSEPLKIWVYWTVTYRAKHISSIHQYQERHLILSLLLSRSRSRCPTPMLNKKLLGWPNHTLQFIGAANVSDAHCFTNYWAAPLPTPMVSTTSNIMCIHRPWRQGQSTCSGTSLKPCLSRTRTKVNVVFTAVIYYMTALACE